MKPKILIIEDESKYAYILERYFSQEDFEVSLAFDGLTGYDRFVSFNPDIICLDIMLPVLDGWEVARRIREKKDTPIIMMSALSEEDDILKGYSLHIDDYITKPFRIPILIAKVKSVLDRRRSLLESTVKNNEVQVGKIKIMRDAYQCFINDELVKLTKTEFKLLEYLMDNLGKNCTREALLLSFWEGKNIDERIIDTYMKKLRKIVVPGDCEIITVFGIGYRLEEKPSEGEDK